MYVICFCIHIHGAQHSYNCNPHSHRIQTNLNVTLCSWKHILHRRSLHTICSSFRWVNVQLYALLLLTWHDVGVYARLCPACTCSRGGQLKKKKTLICDLSVRLKEAGSHFLLYFFYCNLMPLLQLRLQQYRAWISGLFSCHTHIFALMPARPRMK